MEDTCKSEDDFSVIEDKDAFWEKLEVDGYNYYFWVKPSRNPENTLIPKGYLIGHVLIWLKIDDIEPTYEDLPYWESDVLIIERRCWYNPDGTLAGEEQYSALLNGEKLSERIGLYA